MSVKFASPDEQFGDIASPTLRDLMDINWSSEYSLLLFLSNFVVRPMFFDFGHLYCIGREDDVIGSLNSTPVRSRNLADFGRYLVEEVETRAIRRIEKGWFVIGIRLILSTSLFCIVMFYHQFLFNYVCFLCLQAFVK